MQVASSFSHKWDGLICQFCLPSDFHQKSSKVEFTSFWSVDVWWLCACSLTCMGTQFWRNSITTFKLLSSQVSIVPSLWNIGNDLCWFHLELRLGNLLECTRGMKWNSRQSDTCGECEPRDQRLAYEESPFQSNCRSLRSRYFDLLKYHCK